MNAPIRAEQPTMFGCLCDIGEVVGIMRDIAAREISESKPIQGTAIDMLARMIEGHVERAMNLPAAPNRAVSAPEPVPAPADGDRLRPGEINPEDVERAEAEMRGLALLAIGLSDVGREDCVIEWQAVTRLADMARATADFLRQCLTEAEAQT